MCHTTLQSPGQTPKKQGLGLLPSPAPPELWELQDFSWLELRGKKQLAPVGLVPVAPVPPGAYPRGWAEPPSTCPSPSPISCSPCTPLSTQSSPQPRVQSVSSFPCRPRWDEVGRPQAEGS